MVSKEIEKLASYLNEQTHEVLIKELTGLFELYPEVRRYYYKKLGVKTDDEKKAVKTLKNRMMNLILNGRITNAHSELKRFISESGSYENVADLYLYYVEEGVAFLDCCSYDDPLFQHFSDEYADILAYITKHDFEEKFNERAYSVMQSAFDLNWEFGEEMAEIFYSYMRYDEE